MARRPRKVVHHKSPSGLIGQGAPYDAVKLEFGRRLQALLVEKKWNQSDMARAASKHMPSGRFGRDNVSNYVRGLSMPGPVHLKALSEALGCDPEELLPDHAPRGDERTPPLDVRDMGDGRVWLRINQAVDKGVALDVLSLIMKSNK